MKEALISDMCSPDMILMYNPFALIRDVFLLIPKRYNLTYVMMSGYTDQGCIFAANFMSGECMSLISFTKRNLR